MDNGVIGESSPWWVPAIAWTIGVAFWLVVGGCIGWFCIYAVGETIEQRTPDSAISTIDN